MELKEYSKRYIHYYLNELSPAFLRLVNGNIFKVIMDLGCGDGSFLYALKKNGILEEFERVYAVDLSQERIKIAAGVDSRITCLVSDASRITCIRDNEVDLIISNQLIEHVRQEGQVIKEMVRILKDTGAVYLTTVFKKRYGWYFYRNKYRRWVIDPTHEREYTSDGQLLDKLKEYGFKVVFSKKHLHWFAITDFILKRIGGDRHIYGRFLLLRLLRKIKIPIPGYYNWEIICRKHGH